MKPKNPNLSKLNCSKTHIKKELLLRGDLLIIDVAIAFSASFPLDGNLVDVILVGKRNDDDVYKKFRATIGMILK
jgi:hypothetical protein